MTSDEWKNHTRDWDAFLDTSRMKPIKEKLIEQKIDIDEIKKSFEKLFHTTEEAKNLLGFQVYGQQSVVGEFQFFQKEHPDLVPTYLWFDLEKDTIGSRGSQLEKMEQNLTDVDKKVLRTIAQEFSIPIATSWCQIF